MPVGVYIHKSPSEETRRKMSDSHKGLVKTEEHRRKLSVSHTGKHLSCDHRIKLSIAHTGKKLSQEHIDKIANANRGKKRSKEICEMISRNRTGIKLSEETKQKISLIQKGKVLSNDHKQKISKSTIGEKSHCWMGGISYEPYCVKFNKWFRERVRLFFDNTCVVCGEKQSKRKHTVHHVNYDKNTCCNTSKPLFVSLCASCHGKTQVNREYWKAHFEEIINTKFGGKCYLTEKEYSERRYL